jgi:hypothetical protein
MDDSETIAMQELIETYDKLSKLKWEGVRKEYEACCRRSLDNTSDNLALQIRQCARTPGKKRRDEPSNNPSRSDMNPHDWIADAFRRGGLDSLEVTDGKDSFSVGEHFPGLGVNASGMAHPPGFEQEGETADVESCGSSTKSEDKDTTQSTSSPSEISSLHTDEGSCCDDGDDSVDDSQSEATPEGEFDYIYKGGYAMRVNNGQETKGVVPKTVRNVYIHSSVTSIEEGAFQGCNDLESVTISSSVVDIQNNAFRKCSKLKNVVFLTRKPTGGNKESSAGNRPDRRKTSATSRTFTCTSNLRTIGEWAFFNCSALESINLPYGLECIGSRAFQRCSALKLEELPETLVSVGENAFYGCERETRGVLERWESAR